GLLLWCCGAARSEWAALRWLRDRGVSFKGRGSGEQLECRLGGGQHGRPAEGMGGCLQAFEETWPEPADIATSQVPGRRPGVDQLQPARKNPPAQARALQHIGGAPAAGGIG